jgi:hypothetical protein
MMCKPDCEPLEILIDLHMQEGPDNVAPANTFSSAESHPFAKSAKEWATRRDTVVPMLYE